MTTIVKTSSASDFLAIVPLLVGFRPTNSIVFVAFRGKRTCGAIRFDLPGIAETTGAGGREASRVHRRIATTLVGTLSKLPDVDAVVPVVYTDDGFADNGIPRAGFVEAIVARFRYSGFLVRDALCVAADGWGSYLDPDCPPSGRQLVDIESSRVLDDVPLADRKPLGDIASWASLPQVGDEARARVNIALSRFVATLDSVRRGRAAGRDPDAPLGDAVRGSDLDGDLDGDLRGDFDFDFDDGDGDPDDRDPDDRDPNDRGDDDGDLAIRGVLDDIPGMLERIISRDGETVDALSAAFVIAVSRSPAIRDVVMLQWAFDLDIGDRVLDDAKSFSRGAPPGALETAELMLGRGPRPDPERVDAAIEKLKSITALAPDETRAPLFCMLAWLNWALGRSSVARLFVTEAQRVDPDYGLTDLLRTMLERAMLPEWALESA